MLSVITISLYVRHSVRMCKVGLTRGGGGGGGGGGGEGGLGRGQVVGRAKK